MLDAATGQATRDSPGEVRVAVVTNAGSERAGNEDACGVHVEAPNHVLVAIADGVSGYEGGEIASRTAVDVTLRTYRESPAGWGPAKRLFRAAQEANIQIHDRALVVTELRGMSTTLTAVALDGGAAHAVHVGDSRLYLVRDGQITQKTKDHTVAARRRRMGMVSAEAAKNHPAKSTLTRSLGIELIAAIDRITFQVAEGDVLLVCSDGAYNVLNDDELREGVNANDVDAACQGLIDAALKRGAPDNLTVGLLHVTGATGQAASGWSGRLTRWLGG
jgi:protein phosphatase